MRILVASLLLSFLVSSAFSQPAQTDTPVRYGFVKGRSYVYTLIKRNSVTEKGDAEVVDDDVARTQVIHVCITEVEPSGVIDLVLTRLYDRFSGIDNPGVTGALKTPQDDVDIQLQVRISPEGKFCSGQILKLSAELEEARSKRVINRKVRPRLEDSTVVREYLEQLFPQLPPSSIALPRNGRTESERWKDEKQRDVISIVSDSIAGNGERFRQVQTLDANGDPLDRDTLKTMGICTEPGKCYISFDNRYVLRSVLRASDGVPVAWRRNIWWTTASLLTKKMVCRFSSEETVTLEEEKPCEH